ncbi:hypothetical protein TEHAL1_22200 [Tetragenococcus halophilus]|nr:putative holin-like toxin [Tetragenococcus halophilus]GFK25286.1 hypothetical protein YA163_23490 [Tetragenococcus halophilus]GMG64745.1 hypothetical protein TEHAL1_22200 [Tetragenococcus halophilus]GMG66633.1 hypothetical protein TEHIT2_18240 [Tetragenococcus halophilus]GMG68847.1 hypothetical protein TEHMS4_17830 [Tetragenococcus halophilus]
MSVAEALGLMIAFGSLIATLIFGILDAVKKKKNNRQTLASYGYFL